MRYIFYIVTAIAIAIYSLLTYFIGSRMLRILSHWIPNFNAKIYWVILTMIASAYFISRFLKAHMPLGVAKIVTTVGAYWLAAMFYLVLVMVTIDLFVMLLRFMGVVKGSIAANYNFLNVTGIIIFVGLAILLGYGTINARNPRIVEYNIDIAKSAGEIKELTAVLISDVHLGKIIDNKRLIKMVDMVYHLDPDIIFFAGDLVDEDIRPFVKEEMHKTFGKLKPKYGMYACLGNHEYIGGHVNEIKAELKRAGITVLVDEYVLVENSFYVAGRNDSTGARISGVPRETLDSWLVGLDENLPLILLDHQPKEIDESEKQGVDLMLSGHTHRGQMFPNAFVTSAIFEQDWGYLRKGNLQLIVSSGYGTWGPPIRIGTKGEVVKLNISFNN